MEDVSGPTRSERERRKSHRADKPYDRAQQQRPTLRRSASIVDSLKSIVSKPFSWLSGSSSVAPSDVPPVPSINLRQFQASVNGSSKRRAASSGSESSEPQPTPNKKLRRLSPPHAHDASTHAPTSAKKELRASASLPHFASHSAAQRPSRATFLPPLPRTSTPVRQSSVDPTARFGSPAIRASPSIGSTVFTPRAGSLTPQASFENASSSSADRTAFGLRYRSPFMPRASPAPFTGPNASRSLSRQPSILSDRGHAPLTLPKPRTTLRADDGVAGSDRGDSESPTRREFTPAGSPQRKLSDSIGSQLIPPFQSATLKRADSVPFPSGESSFERLHQRSSTFSPNGDASLSLAQRTISHVASLSRSRANSPEKTSNDRIFQALEEALPWSQSRKLRHEQRARIKVPTPSAHSNSRLAARAGRMVMPYGRGNEGESSGDKDKDVEMDVVVDRTFKEKGLLEALEEKRAAAAAGKKKAASPEPEKVEKGKAPPQGVNPPPSSSTATSLFEKPATSSSEASLSSILPPLSSIAEDSAESSEPLPFALVPTATSSIPTPSSQSSSLRERRTKTSAVHTTSAPRRPGPAQEKRPNRFAMDEDEAGGNGGDDADAEEAELQSWASKTGIALEIPLNWSFGGGATTTTTNGTAAAKAAGTKEGETAKGGEGKAQKPNPFGHSMPSAFGGSSTPSPFSLPPSTSQKATEKDAAEKKAPPFGSLPPFSSTAPSAPTESKTDTAPKTSFFPPPAPATSTAAAPSPFTGFGGASSSSSSSSAPNLFAAGAAKPASNPFGSSATTSTPFGNANPFGSSASSASPFGGTSLFGGASKPAESAPAKDESVPSKAVEEKGPASTPAPVFTFGAASNGAGAAKESPFGKPSVSTSTPVPASATAPGSSIFGGTFGKAAPSSSPFGQSSAFGGSLGKKDDKPAALSEPSATAEVKSPPTSVTSPPAEASKSPVFPAPAGSSTGALGFGFPTSFGSKPEPSKSPSAEAAPAPSPFALPKSTPSFTFGAAPSASGAGTPTAATPTSIFGAAATSTAPVFGSSTPTEPFKFGATSATKTTVEAPKAGESAPKSLFSFGSVASSAAESKPTLTPQPSFTFGGGGFGTTSAPARPKTPPSTNPDNTMETSPVQSVTTTPAAVANGTSPFAFGGQATPSFNFGASSQPITSFGAPTPTVPSFSFNGGSRPGTPSSPFPQTSSFGGAAPSSPFGAPPPLPSSNSFAFGSGSTPQPGTPTGAGGSAFNFGFSPVASPVLSPTNLSSASSAPFVFGAGGGDSGAGAQTPGTPTTPGRRPMRSLPARKKR